MLKVAEESRVVRSFSAVGAAAGNRTPRSFPGNGFEITLAASLASFSLSFWLTPTIAVTGTYFVPVAPHNPAFLFAVFLGVFGKRGEFFSSHHVH
jgi:hypothetical protein